MALFVISVALSCHHYKLSLPGISGKRPSLHIPLEAAWVRDGVRVSRAGSLETVVLLIFMSSGVLLLC